MLETTRSAFEHFDATVLVPLLRCEMRHESDLALKSGRANSGPASVAAFAGRATYALDEEEAAEFGTDVLMSSMQKQSMRNSDAPLVPTARESSDARAGATLRAMSTARGAEADSTSFNADTSKSSSNQTFAHAQTPSKNPR